MSTQVTVFGRLGRDPEIRFTQGGKPVASLSLVSSRRRQNPQTQEWEDSEVTWYDVSAWESLAEAAAECLLKGDAVIVTGRLYTESFDGKDGARRTVVRLRADHIGPDLARSMWKRADEVQARPARQQEDPWSSTDETPPF